MLKWIFVLGAVFSQTLWAGPEQIGRPEWKLGDHDLCPYRICHGAVHRTEKTNVAVFVSERTTDYYTLKFSRVDSEEGADVEPALVPRSKLYESARGR